MTHDFIKGLNEFKHCVSLGLSWTIVIKSLLKVVEIDIIPENKPSKMHSTYIYIYIDYDVQLARLYNLSASV